MRILNKIAGLKKGLGQRVKPFVCLKVRLRICFSKYMSGYGGTVFFIAYIDLPVCFVCLFGL